MPSEQFETRYYRGQGKIFIGDRDAAGKAINLLFIGDITDAELTPDIQRQEIIENVTGTGQVGASWVTSQKYNFRMTAKSVKHAHLASHLQASNTAKTSASVTDEAHTVKLGGFSALAHPKVSAVTVTGTGGTPTYVADTDYKLHAAEGMIEWLSGGTVTDALAVLVDYTHAAQHHMKVNPAQVSKYLVFAGKNSADSDKQTRCEIYKIKFDPGALGLIQSQSGAEITMSGVVEVDGLRAAGDQLFSWKTED